jgi:uncharacterized protein YdiU (UPF0061 family)
LCSFKPSLVKGIKKNEPSQDPTTAFVNKILGVSPNPNTNDPEATEDLVKWLEAYAQRIESEKEEWSEVEDIDSARQKEMKSVNPRFVLRQWLLEEVIGRVEGDVEKGKRVLTKVMQVSLCFPFSSSRLTDII